MQPFSIKCDSCGSRLKVRKRSAIGQILNCPKCQSMVQIVPPSDWQDDQAATAVPTDQTPDANTDHQETVDALGSDFDDVESLVRNAEAAQSIPKSGTVRQQTTTSSGRDAKRGSDGPAIPTPNADADPATPPDGEPHTGKPSPILPTDNWTSEATKSRRKLVGAIVGAISLLCVTVMLVGYLLVRMSGGDGEQVAQGDPSAADSNVDRGIENEQDQPSNRDDDSNVPTPTDDVDPLTVDPAEDLTDSTADDSAQTQPNDLTGDVDASTDPDQVDVNQLANDPADTTENGAASNTTQADPPGFSRDQVETSDRTRIGSPILTDLDGFDSWLNDAEAPPSGIVEARQAVDQQRRADSDWLFGLQVPYVKPPQQAPIDMDRRLSLRLGSVSQSGMTLVEMIDFFSGVTNVPITISADVLQLPDVDFETTIDLDIREEAIGDALRNHLQHLGLDYQILTHSLRIVSLEASAESTEVAFSVADLLPGFGNDPNALMDVVRRFTMPRLAAELEVNVEAPQLRVQAGDLYVDDLPSTHRKTSDFLNALREIRDLPITDGAAPSSWALSPSQRSDEILKRKVNVELYQPTRLSKVVNEFCRIADIEIIVDWERLGEQGWTLETELPLVIQDQTIEYGLRMLAGSLDLRYRVVGEGQFELTTENQYYQQPEIAFYDCEEILQTAISPADLRSLIAQVFPYVDESSADFPYYFDPESQTIVAKLVSDEHRALDKMLNAWYQITARGGP